MVPFDYAQDVVNGQGSIVGDFGFLEILNNAGVKMGSILGIKN
jgi:hypothetical protein